MKKRSRYLVILLSFLLLAGCAACGKQQEDGTTPNTGIDFNDEICDIIANGTSEYSIVLPEDADECELYAAEELASFLQQATEVSLPVLGDEGSVASAQAKVISLGDTVYLRNADLETDYSTLNHDGFVMKTNGNNLLINGARNSGTLYGVYDFLERYIGVKFLTTDYTYVPPLKTLKLYTTNVEEAPAFAIREYLSYQTARDGKFSARLRQSSTYRAYEEKFGAGGSSDYYMGDGHTIEKIVPKDVYQADHADWYADPAGTEICYTNGVSENGLLLDGASCARQMIENSKRIILDNPKGKFLMLGQADNAIWCDCKRCKASDKKYNGKSGTMMVFINLIAKELEEWGKTVGLHDINVVTFAYWKTFNPPVKNDSGKFLPSHENVIARNNVYVKLAHLESCYAHAVEDETCGENASTRMKFEGWKAVTDRFLIWEYTVNFRNFLWYYPDLGVIQDNLLLYKNMGAVHVMSQGAPHAQNFYTSSLQMYLFGKMLWNPEQDVMPIVEEFNRYYFGEIASPYVNQYLSAMELHIAALDSKLVGGFHSDQYNTKPNFHDPACYPVGLLEQTMKYCDDAIAAVIESDQYTEQEIYDLETRLLSVKVTPQQMLLYNFSAYYDSRLEQNFAINFFGNLDRLGILYYGEGDAVATYKAQYGIS